MSDRYYDDGTRGRDGYLTPEYRYSSTGPHYNDHNTTTRDYYGRSSDNQLVRHDHRNNSLSNYDDLYDDRRRHSLSPSHIRRDSSSFSHIRRDSSSSSHARRDDEPHHHRHHHHHHHDHDASRRERTEHHPGRDIAATVLGGIVGGTAGKRASDHSHLGTAAGVLIGAWGGHELEKQWEGHETKEKARRNSEYHRRS